MFADFAGWACMVVGAAWCSVTYSMPRGDGYWLIRMSPGAFAVALGVAVVFF